MGLIRMTKQGGREKPCNSQSIFVESDRPSGRPERSFQTASFRGGGAKEKWSNDLYGSSARQGRPDQIQQRPPPRRFGGQPSANSNMPDSSDRMRGWSDDAPARGMVSKLAQRGAPQRTAAPQRSGVRKTIIKKGRQFGSRATLVTQRSERLAPAATQAAFQDRVGDDSAYSSTGLYGPLHARGNSGGKSWRPKGGGKNGRKGGFGKGKGGKSGGKGARGGKSGGKGSGRGGKWGTGRKGKGRGKGKW